MRPPFRDVAMQYNAGQRELVVKARMRTGRRSPIASLKRTGSKPVTSTRQMESKDPNTFDDVPDNGTIAGLCLIVDGAPQERR